MKCDRCGVERDLEHVCLDALKAENAALRERLEKYANHTRECAVWDDPETNMCTCGFVEKPVMNGPIPMCTPVPGIGPFTGTHDYPGTKAEQFFTSDCVNGCGCWMGSSRSGGPDGVDPFGDCPNPKSGGK